MKRAGIVAAVLLLLLAGWLTRDRWLRPPTSDGHRTASLTPAPAVPRPVVQPDRPDTALEARLTSILSRASGRCAVMAKRIGTGEVARVNANAHLPLLSVVKLPVALVVLDSVDRGGWTLDTPIPLIAQDMHPRGWLGDRYPRGGGSVKLHTLLVAMLTRSDNSAADALMRVVGGPLAVTAWLERHGIHDLRVDRPERELGDDWYGLASGADSMWSAEEIRELRAQVSDAAHDSAAQAMLSDPRDTGTAESCVNLLDRLWRGELLTPAMTDTLKGILGRCKTAPHRMTALLPKGTPVARKTGTGGTWRGVTVGINDIGVIRLPNGEEVALAVLVAEPRGPVIRTERVIARVARTVFDAWSGTSARE
jgi:beta-lactamase class A